MEWEYTYTALSHVRQNSMTLLHTSRWWTSNRHILSFWMAVPFSSSFWSAREIALTCTAFIVSSLYEKIVDYYFVVLLKKIFLALQVPVVLLLYMTSLSTQFHADKPLAIKNPCRCFNSGCTDSLYRFVGIAKPWNLKLIINIDMGKKKNQIRFWVKFLDFGLNEKFRKSHWCISINH